MTTLDQFMQDNLERYQTEAESEATLEKSETLDRSVPGGGRITSSLSLIKSEIVSAYRYIKIGDKSGFQSALNKIILNTKDEHTKAQAHYLSGLLKFEVKEYKKAAQSFLDGYKQDNDGLFGVYNLFGLAKAMNRLDRREESCAAVTKLLKLLEQDDVVYPTLFSEEVIDYHKKHCFKK